MPHSTRDNSSDAKRPLPQPISSTGGTNVQCRKAFNSAARHAAKDGMS